MAAATLNKPRARNGRKKARKVTCEECFFHRNMLCALDASEPCPTFRHHEDGLRPPQQLEFVFRQPRTRAAWTFDEVA